MQNLDDIAHQAMRDKVLSVAKTAKDTRLRLEAPPKGVDTKPRPGDVIDVPTFKKGLRAPVIRKFKINAIGPNGEWLGEWV